MVQLFDRSMQIAGERIRRTKLVQTDQFVAVDVEMIIPDEDPSEPCLEPETVQLLKEVKERATEGDVAWLREHGKVYAALEKVSEATRCQRIER